VGFCLVGSRQGVLENKGWGKEGEAGRRWHPL